MSRWSAYIFLLIGRNGGHIARFVSRRVDVHVKMAGGVESNFVSLAHPLCLFTGHSAAGLDLLYLSLNV